MAWGVRRIKPLEEHTTDGWKSARAVRRGLDTGAEAAKQWCRIGVAGGGQILDVPEHVLQRVRVLADDLDPNQLRYNLFGGNCADAADVLRHDEVRLQIADGLNVDVIERAALRGRQRHLGLDAAAVLIHQAQSGARHDRQRRYFGW